MGDALSSTAHDGSSGRKSGNGIGVAALVVGIAACVAALFPMTALVDAINVLPLNGPVTWPTMFFGGIIGVVLGVIGVRRAHVGKASNLTTAKIGIALSLIALIICAGWVALNLTSAPS